MVHELHHFLLVVEHGTLTAAARHAHLSQPALTASIQRLEQAMAARLLERGRSGARVTAAGEALLPHARAALAAVEDGRRAVAEVQGLAAGEVRIGAGATACTYLLPERLAAFRAAHPGIIFRLREGSPEVLLDLLEAGTIDLAVRAGDAGERWTDDHLVLVTAPGVDARRAPFVTFPPGSSTRGLLQRHFPEARVAMELSGIGAIKSHVRAGIGVALVSTHAVARELADGRLVQVPDPRTPVTRTLRLVHRGVDRLPPAAAALRAALLAEGAP